MYDNEYLESKVLTASGPQLHLMVVEGAIRFARQGKESLEKQDYELSHERLTRSREFVTELISGLNPEMAPEMITTLKELFAYIYRNLALADIKLEVEPIETALTLLNSHRETWLELVQQLPEQQTAESPAQAPTEWEG